MMNNNKNIKAPISIAALSGLSPEERLALLKDHGYMVGTPHFSFLPPEEWAQLKEADNKGYILFDDIDLLSCEVESIPFILKDNSDGSVIDEINHIRVAYYISGDGTTPKWILKAWVQGTEPEGYLVVNASEKDGYRFPVVFPGLKPSPENDFIITKHDIKCLECYDRYLDSDDEKHVIPLCDGRYAIAGNAWPAIPAKTWTGPTVCGDGEMADYARRLVCKRLYPEPLYKAWQDKGNSFSTAEEAYEYAWRHGIRVK